MRLTLPKWKKKSLPSVAIDSPPWDPSSSFQPRKTFAVSANITRSYFLGHHAGGLANMRAMLSNVGLIIECRDARVPLVSTNPLLESSLAGRDRIIAYLKSDLAFPVQSDTASTNERDDSKMERQLNRKEAIKAFERNMEHIGSSSHDSTQGGAGKNSRGTNRTLCINTTSSSDINRLLHMIRDRAVAMDSMLGLRAMIVGMPNVGKSTLLNALRRRGMNLGGAARVGDQPGITQKLSTPVRVIPADEAAGIEQGVFMIDTPGVFVPYVADPEAMLKLALVGSVKDGLVPAITLADYLLFRLNQQDRHLYHHVCPVATNDVDEFLTAIALRTGKLLPGGEPSLEAAAVWIIQQFRNGRLGEFQLDDTDAESLAIWHRARNVRNADGTLSGPLSMNQARKQEKEQRKIRNAEKQAAARS